VKISARIIFVWAVLVIGLVVSADAQRKPKQKAAQPKTDTLATLRDDYIRATKDFKTHLQKLLALYEKSVTKAEAEHKKSESLF
jgi:hypothetical protein